MGLPNFVNPKTLDFPNLIINKISDSEYEFISFSLKIDILSNYEYLKKYIALIKNIAQEKHISKCMFVIKTATYDMVLEKINLQKTNQIIIELKTQFNEILMHKNPYNAIQTEGLTSLAFEYDKQTNSSSQDVMPFLKSKTSCYFSKLAFGNVKSKNTKNNAEYEKLSKTKQKAIFNSSPEKYFPMLN